MSPADKRRLAFISLLAIVLFFLVLTCIPTYLYILFFFVVTCAVCYYKAEEFQLFERLGLNPRRGLTVPTALRRWLPGRTFTGVPAAGRNKTRTNKSDVRNSLASPSDRSFASSVSRRDATFSDSVFSPRNILMGSYLGKAESPSGTGRPAGGSGCGGNPREQLRQRLVRPNHGVPTPNRRLSFGSDPVGAAGRFTITPQRHYPLQQIGSSPVGVFPPAQWDGFRKKNILTQRNTPIHSPVTVKIARPDNTARFSFFDQVTSAGAVTSPGFEARADPCSRETVLSVLRASRKRDVDDDNDDDERAHEAGQKSKRRRNDSSGSSQSVFEPLLANGAPSQLVPKPGSLKRGMNVSMLEESVVKRSRTSSISSVSGCPVSCGVPGSARNPIRSSYSSSQGYSQRRLASNLSSSPLVSPGSSQSQTPERVAKKPREENATSPNSDSAINSDKTATETAPGSGKCTPMPDPPVTSRSDSGGNSGQRKRKIQLVSMCKGDQISLPPPPELGYTITVKDLDMEKKAALTQIQKVLEEPEPEKPSHAPYSSTPTAAPSVGMFSQVVSFSSTSAAPVGTATSLASLSTPAAGLPPASTAVSTPAPAPTIDLTVTPPSTVSAAPVQSAVLPTPTTSTTVATPVANPLLESLKSMKSSSLLSVPSTAAATSAAPATTVAAQAPPSITPTALNFGAVKSEPSIATPQPTVSTAPSSVPSAFAQILAQPLPSSSTTLNLGGSSLFGLTTSTPAACAATAPTASAQPASSIANPTQSGFKPIFGPAMTTPVSAAEGKPTQTTFKPIFGSVFNQPASSPSSVPATQSSTSVFGGVTNTQPMSSSVPSSVPSTQNPSQSVFGSQTNSQPVAASVSTSSTQKPIPALFGGLTNSQTVAASVSSSSSNTQNSTPSLFGGLPNSQPMAASVLPSSSNTQNPAPSLFCGLTSSQPMAASISSSSSTQNSTTSLFGNWSAAKSTFQFGGPSSTAASSGISTSTTTTNSTSTTLQFGALKPAPTALPAAPQNTFSFGQSPATTTFTGFGMANNTTPMTSNTPATQATFGSSVFSASTCFANPQAQAQAPTPVKPFTFGASVGGGTAVTPLTFGTPASTAAPTFGNSTQPAFGGASTGFAFGNTSALPVSTASMPAPAFTFGAAPATPQNTATPGGFNFTATLSGAQFGTPAPAGQNQGFAFGAGNTDNKSAFGTSTPAFGNASGPMPFGSPGTPVGGFSASAFGTPSATFSIGAGSKPSSSRQRLQARRQHTRKK
ncbi:hypothetical protein PHYPO_G00079310 [Pangasianodon hypophthalmus]|uniref:POM121 transmembrane nucleoporin n=1 Tax=Pangasianodon hypophthalmus TaxID=310915 RepID=A0A5N5LMX3_PANHP|nr:hypothetical protein PHYPO_G00079310 [Pangasianodon hypophthalmus]